MTTTRQLLLDCANRAATYIESTDNRPVAPQQSRERLLKSLGGAVPELGTDDGKVLADLVSNMEPGLLHTTHPRFFGWVIGGTLPAALAADHMTAAWDQNAGAHDCSPSSAVLEEVCGRWLKELFGLPKQASFAFVTGCQMAHVTALAAARYRLYANENWDVGKQGLVGAPRIRVLSSAQHHETFARALRLLGLGTDCIEIINSDEDGRISPSGLQAYFEDSPQMQTIVCLQAGDLNTGVFDPFEEVCAIAHDNGAWVHVDGAFGLWAQVSPKYRHLSAGIENADSWATDGHKWLNVPYDCGYAFVADSQAHRSSMSMAASYVAQADDECFRNQSDWGPEWSRRARSIPTYAAIRALGRTGIAEMIERCCRIAGQLVIELGKLDGAEVISHATINQGLVRFTNKNGDHDRRTDEIIAAIVADGTAWFGGVTWRGMRVMRISVCNWKTTEDDIRPTVDAVKRVLAAQSE